MLIFTNDKKRLLRHFNKDPVLFAYHIGDLDDFYFNDCTWGSIYGRIGGIEDLLLLYRGCDQPTLLAFGLENRFPQLIAEFLPLLPDKFFCHYQKKDEVVFTKFFQKNDLGSFIKMKLTDFNKTKYEFDSGKIVRLDHSHEADIKKLYQKAYPENYFVTKMLETGKYLGYSIDNTLVAISGVHVSSDEYNMAVLGNITTDPDYRRKGIASRLTSILSEELLNEGKSVCLNVKDDNMPAIKCYKSLGFEKVHDYQEAFFELKK